MRHTIFGQRRRPLLSGHITRLAVGCLVVFSGQAAPLPATAFAKLARACVPQASLETLHALVAVESAFHPNALSLNYPANASKRLGFGAGTLHWSASHNRPGKHRPGYGNSLPTALRPASGCCKSTPKTPSVSG